MAGKLLVHTHNFFPPLLFPSLLVRNGIHSDSIRVFFRGITAEAGETAHVAVDINCIIHSPSRHFMNACMFAQSTQKVHIIHFVEVALFPVYRRKNGEMEAVCWLAGFFSFLFIYDSQPSRTYTTQDPITSKASSRPCTTFQMNHY